MASDNENIVNGIVGLVKSDLRPDKLIAPGTSDHEDREFKFQSRLLSELRDIREVIQGAERHLQRIESLIEGTYTSQPNKTPYRANTDVEVPSYVTKYTRAERSQPIDVEVVNEPSAVQGGRGAQTQTTPALPYEEQKLLGNGENLLPVLAPDTEIEVQDWDKGLKCFRDILRVGSNILDIIKDEYLNNKKDAEVTDEEKDVNSNLAMVKKGYNDVEVPGVQTIRKKRKEPKWLRNIIGSGVALMGMGELDDHFGNGITEWLYSKASGFKDGKDVRYPEGKVKTVKAAPDKRKQEEQARKDWEESFVYGKGYDAKKDKRWKEKGPVIDAEIIEDEAGANVGEQEWAEDKQNDRIAGLLEEINERVQDIDPMTPTQMEDVLDKQRAEEDAVASMGERLDGEDIKTDVYEEGFARQEKNDDENQKGLLDALGGIGELLKAGGPIMGVLSTIGTTLAVLGTAVGGFIAGWKLEEYLDAKFDIVNKSLAGIDNTLGSSLFTTAEEKAEKEFEANKGETMQEFTATDYGKQWENLQSSRRQLTQENKELDERIKKGDKVAERLKEKNLQRDKEYSEKMQDLAVLRDASEDENYEANIQKEIEDMNEALENGTWNDLYDNQGFSYDSKERLESDLKLKKEVLDRLHKLQQKERDKEIEANKLKEGEEYEKISEEWPSNEELKNAWANALPDKSSKELENGEPKLNPEPLADVSDETLTDLIQMNRKNALSQTLAVGLMSGTSMDEKVNDISKVDDWGVDNEKLNVREGYHFTENRKKELKEGDFLHFDPESYSMSGQVKGKEYDVPGFGVLAPGFYEEHYGRTRQDALEDVLDRGLANKAKMKEEFDLALLKQYDVEHPLHLTEDELRTGDVQRGGIVLAGEGGISPEDQNAIDEIKEIYNKRLVGLEQLQASLDNPEEGTYLGDRIKEEFDSIYNALETLEKGNFDLRWERGKEYGDIAKWEFGKFDPKKDWLPDESFAHIPSVKESLEEVLPDKEFTDENVDYLTNLLGIDTREGEKQREPIKEPEPQYYEWNAPTNWDEFIESPLMRDVHKTVGTIYPYKGVSETELGDYDILGKKLSEGAKSGWAAALSKAKVSEKPITFSETTEVPVVEGSVVQSRSKDELPDNLSEEVKGYEDRKIELLEDLNKNLKNQQRSIVVGGGGDGGSVMMPSDMRMSVDDVGLSLVNMGFFD